MLFGYCPYQSNSIANLISTINSNEIVFPPEINQVSEKTQSLIRKMMTKDYFRRISWVELFGYKINEEGNYMDSNAMQSDVQSNAKSSFSIKKSVSAIKEHSDTSEFEKVEV